jgi:hypothetical protein
MMFVFPVPETKFQLKYVPCVVYVDCTPGVPERPARWLVRTFSDAAGDVMLDAMMLDAVMLLLVTTLLAVKDAAVSAAKLLVSPGRPVSIVYGIILQYAALPRLLLKLAKLDARALLALARLLPVRSLSAVNLAAT